MKDLEAVEVITHDLAKVVAQLRRICRDRVQHPADSERLDDLRVALLEGHELLGEINNRYGGPR